MHIRQTASNRSINQDMWLIDLFDKHHILHFQQDRTFILSKNQKYDGYQRGLASTVYLFLFFFWKKTLVVLLKMNFCQTKNQQNSYTSQLLTKLKNLDNICGADLAGIKLISKYNKGNQFLLSVINVISKYIWVVPLKGTN